MTRPALSKTLWMALVLVLLGLLAGCYVLYTSVNNAHNRTRQRACAEAEREGASASEVSIEQAICAGTVKP